jgi:vacuolar-type H+-ATPase subunit D/Vma8
MDLDQELIDLMEAHKLLENKRKELLSEAFSVYNLVNHAMRHVDGLINDYLRGAL